MDASALALLLRDNEGVVRGALNRLVAELVDAWHSAATPPAVLTASLVLVQQVLSRAGGGSNLGHQGTAGANAFIPPSYHLCHGVQVLALCVSSRIGLEYPCSAFVDKLEQNLRPASIAAQLAFLEVHAAGAGGSITHAL